MTEGVKWHLETFQQYISTLWIVFSNLGLELHQTWRCPDVARQRICPERCLQRALCARRLQPSAAAAAADADADADACERGSDRRSPRWGIWGRPWRAPWSLRMIWSDLRNGRRTEEHFRARLGGSLINFLAGPFWFLTLKFKDYWKVFGVKVKSTSQII